MNVGARLLREIVPMVSKELRDVLRDRRAAFFTFLFPLALYPFLFVISERVQALGGSDEIDGSVRVGVSGDFDEFSRFLAGDTGFLVVTGLPLKRKHIESGEFDVVVRLTRREGEDSRLVATVLHDSALPLSRQAYRRVAEALERYRLELVTRRLRSHGVEAPHADVVRLETRDIALGEERAQAMLARFLPCLLILLFFTGGAFAAVDLVAGEKERGTLETLFVQPVRPGLVVAAKFIVVFVCSFLSAALNLVGMMLARRLQPDSGIFAFPLPPWSSLMVILISLLPLAVLTSAVLIAVSSKAGTFREAQTLLVPVMIAGLLPALIAAVPSVQFNVATACVPVANVSLAVREMLVGQVRGLPLLLAFASTAAYAVWALRWAAGLLRREDVILGGASEPLDREYEARRHARRALCFACVMLLFVYYTGTLVQSPHGLGPYWGLAVTLWGLVLLPALAYPVTQDLPLRAALALRRPRRGDIALAVACVPAVAVLVTAYLALQHPVLPVPAGLENRYREILDPTAIHPLIQVFLFAVSPAICEEILWRGTVQGELERERRPLKTIIIVGLLFGVFHLSLYRLVPTALLGCLLAYMRWRTGSLFPSIVFHAGYNAFVIFVLSPLHEAHHPLAEAARHPLTVVGAGVMVYVAARRLGTGRG